MINHNSESSGVKSSNKHLFPSLLINTRTHKSDQALKTITTESFTFTNRCNYLLVLEITKIYIKIRTKMLLHVSVCDHHQGARTWA